MVASEGDTTRGYSLPEERNKYSSQELCLLRQGLVDQIYALDPVEKDQKQLAQIAKTLSHLAGNEPTAYESATVQTSATGSSNLLSRQVERAITQVLGRSPGRGPDGFMSALKGTFPTDAKGKVIFTPTRSLVSLSGSNGNGSTGQISVEQGNLHRMGSLIASDALRVLEGLKPFDPKADVDSVEALRALIRSRINSLIEEFGRLDEPRKERVEHYLNALNSHLEDFGMAAFAPGAERQAETSSEEFIQKNVHPVTEDDEAQLAGFILLFQYVSALDLAWKRFHQIDTKLSVNYSANLSRASVLLPIIADSNASFMSAMDSIGFTESERRSRSFKFSTLQHGESLSFECTVSGLPPSIPYTLADITLSDLNEWIDQFASVESPSLLTASGCYGLTSVFEQADMLFWVVGLLLYTLFHGETESTQGKESDREEKTVSSPYRWLGNPAKSLKNAELGSQGKAVPSNNGSKNSSLLQEIFSQERVKQSIRELLFYLKELADLPCKKENCRNNNSV